MASLHREIWIDAAAELVWDAARDVGELHTRLVPGFVVNTQLDGETRVVTFGNGRVVREPIVSVDDERRRLVWTSEGGPLRHESAVLEIHAEARGCRVTWTIDLLPHAMTEQIGAMQEQGLATMKRTLEAAAHTA